MTLARQSAAALLWCFACSAQGQATAPGMAAAVANAPMAPGQTAHNAASGAAACAAVVEQEMLTRNPNYSVANQTLDERITRARLEVQCARLTRARVAGEESTPQGQLLATEATQPVVAEKERDLKVALSEDDYLGLNWGLGFGFSFSSREGITDAEIVNGVVRVKAQAKQQPRLVLEFHKFFWCHGKDEGTKGCGPFVAVSATSEKVLSGVGLGLMYGMKTKKEDKEGFSVGVGFILDSEVKDLASGFEKDRPPPAGETTVRFEEKSRWSGLFFVTRTF